MITIPAEPKPGDRISANHIRSLIRCIRALRPIQGPGIKLAEGPNGTNISLDANDRPKKRHHRPFEVVGSDEEDYKFAIYVPDNVVSIGNVIARPTGITRIGANGDWYTLDCEGEIEEDGTTLYLIANSDGTSVFKCDLEDDDSEDEDNRLAVLPVAELALQTLGEVTIGVVKRQLASHPLVIAADGSMVFPDDKSTCWKTEPGEEEGDPAEETDELEIFGWKEQDPAQTSLVSILGIDPDTSQSPTDHELVVRCGKDGALIYLPIGKAMPFSSIVSVTVSEAYDQSGRHGHNLTIVDKSHPAPGHTVFIPDGIDGSDGAHVSAASAGTPTQSSGFTVTPVTFTLSDGSHVGPVNISAKNGSLAGTVDFIGDIAYDITNHRIMKRVDHLNLATGAVTFGSAAAAQPPVFPAGYVTITNGQAVAHSQL